MSLAYIAMLLSLDGYHVRGQPPVEEPSHVIKGAAGQTVVFSADGKNLFTGGGYSEGVNVWDTTTWELVRVVGKGSFLTVGPDSKTVATAYHEGGNVDLWDVTTAKKIRSLTAPAAT